LKTVEVLSELKISLVNSSILIENFSSIMLYKSFYVDIYQNNILARLIDVVNVQRRSWPEITTEILEATLNPSNKMRIMYKSNLNFERFNRYFYDLLRKGFIEEKNGSKGQIVYKTTKRGKTLLEVLRKAQELVFSEEH